MKRADRLSIVEAAWSLTPRADVWLGQVARSFASVLPESIFPVAMCGVAEPDRFVVRLAQAARCEGDLQAMKLSMEHTPVSYVHAVRRTFGTGYRAFGYHDVIGSERHAEMLAALEAFGASDVFMAGLEDADTSSVLVMAAMPSRLRLDGATRGEWIGVAAHIAAAFRARQRGLLASLDDAELVADVDGGLVHARDAGTTTEVQELVRHHVRAIEASRRGAAGADLPEAMIEGRFSIVERRDNDGRRYFVLIQNPRPGRTLRRLRPREAAVVRAAAVGTALKQIALDLGVDEASVSRALRLALRKLGLRSQGELVLAFHALHSLERGVASNVSATTIDDETVVVIQDLRMRLCTTSLTEAEQAIAPMLAAGIADRTIAAERGVQVRTVASQAASIYRKLAVSSRAELAVTLARPATAVL